MCATDAASDTEGTKMKINSKDFRVRPGEKVKLSKWPTIVKPFCKSKEQYQALLAEHVEKLSSLQHLHYASNRYALLLIFQGMDAGGKDGAIRHVMSGVNPQGCQVFSFKQPSADELEHDFLWRTTRCLPERGRIGIFNRSYYEEVLVVRVHPEILRSQGLSEELRDEKTIWKERYRSIAWPLAAQDEVLWKYAGNARPVDWSRDGRYIVALSTNPTTCTAWPLAGSSPLS